MKLTASPLLPLLLIACASEAPASKPKSDPTKPVAAQPMAKLSPPAAAVPQAPAAPAAKTVEPVKADPAAKAAALAAPATIAAHPTEAAPQAATPKTAAPQAATPATQTPPPPTPPAAKPPVQKPQSFAVQMPTVPPTPCPVVIGPPAKVDPLSLSGKNLGGPIKVFDKQIDENAIRRFLCYGVGTKHIDILKFDVLCKSEIAKRKTAGEDVSSLTVSDAEVEKALGKMRKDFLLKYPTLDFPTEVGRGFLNIDVYKSELNATLLFDKAFFPDDPLTWPGVTTEAIIANSGGRAFVDDFIENYQKRKQMQIDQKLEDLPPDDPILVDTLRSWVLGELDKFATIEINPAKMPADTLLVVEGVPIKVDDVWKPIQPFVTWENVADARRYLTQMAVVEHDLNAHGVLMSQEDFEKDFAKNRPYREALTDFEMVAIVLQGFPSMQADVTYERMQRSYRKLIKDEIGTDAQLMPYLQRANQIAGAAKMDCEVILASAFDFLNNRWKVDGWKAAETKARDLKARLDGGADWGDTLELYSDFWDPPMPEVGQKPQFGFNFKGRFGVQTRNQLAGDLLENDYTIFLHGKALADDIFFDQKGGSISDVMKGTRGYYIARVNSRTPASAGLNLQAPANREFLLNFVAMQRFGAYARQLLTDALAKGDVSGF